jgi:hypothetical protein
MKSRENELEVSGGMVREEQQARRLSTGAQVVGEGKKR